MVSIQEVKPFIKDAFNKDNNDNMFDQIDEINKQNIDNVTIINIYKEMTSEIYSTRVKYNIEDSINYYETYKLNFEFQEIEGIIINGVILDSECTSYDIDKGLLIVNGFELNFDDKIIIIAKIPTKGKKRFDIVSVQPNSYEVDNVNNKSIISILENFEHRENLISCFGCIINGINYLDNDFNFNPTTNTITVNFIINSDDEIGLYVYYSED